VLARRMRELYHGVTGGSERGQSKVKCSARLAWGAALQTVRWGRREEEGRGEGSAWEITWLPMECSADVIFR
jgi:hypothetical protein